MEELTPKQQRKLEKIVKIVEDGDLAIAEHLLEMEDNFEAKVEEIKSSVPDLNKVLETVKGKDGAPGEKGEIGETGEQGERGPQGEKGQDGKDGKNGKDGRDGRDGRDGIDGLNGKDGIDGKDGSPDTPEQVTEKINISKKLIRKEKIEGLADIQRMVTTNLSTPVTTNFFNGLRGKNLTIVGATATQSGDTVQVTIPGGSGSGDVVGPTGAIDGHLAVFDGTTGKLIKDGGAIPSGTIAVETPTGTVDGTNVTFTVSATPKWIVSDGAIYFDGAGYSLSTLTVTMTVPPVGFIRSIY